MFMRLSWYASSSIFCGKENANFEVFLAQYRYLPPNGQLFSSLILNAKGKNGRKYIGACKNFMHCVSSVKYALFKMFYQTDIEPVLFSTDNVQFLNLMRFVKLQKKTLQSFIFFRFLTH